MWLQAFDFNIVYKAGYLNCIADMLTREESNSSSLLGFKMFHPGSSSLGKEIQPAESSLPTHWDNSLSSEEHQQTLEYASIKEAYNFLSISLIKQIQGPP